MFNSYFEGERVKTPHGDADVLEDTNGADFVPVRLDNGRLEEFMTFELSRLGIPA